MWAFIGDEGFSRRRAPLPVFCDKPKKKPAIPPKSGRKRAFWGGIALEKGLIDYSGARWGFRAAKGRPGSFTVGLSGTGLDLSADKTNFIYIKIG
jgi:hypothetical protein